LILSHSTRIFSLITLHITFLFKIDRIMRFCILLMTLLITAINVFHTSSNDDIQNFNLILSGDIEQNPGPSPKCTECNKGVGTNRKRLMCDVCMSLTHLSCSTIPTSQHKLYNSRAAYSCLLMDMQKLYS